MCANVDDKMARLPRHYVILVTTSFSFLMQTKDVREMNARMPSTISVYQNRYHYSRWWIWKWYFQMSLSSSERMHCIWIPWVHLCNLSCAISENRFLLAIPCFVSHYSAVTDFIHQNMTFIDIRLWLLKSIPALNEKQSKLFIMTVDLVELLSIPYNYLKKYYISML